MLCFLAQADPITAKMAMETADVAASKDMKWWFVVLLMLFGVATLTALKWLLASHQNYLNSMQTQLTEQRQANAKQNEDMLDYIKTDHEKSVLMLGEVSRTLQSLAEAIRERRSV